MSALRWNAALLLPLVVSCSSQLAWRNDDALASERIEVQVDAEGRPLELEYHVAPADVPKAVHAAMDALHPGGRVTGGEKEYKGEEMFWELAKNVGGREVEAMFRANGQLVSEELEVDAADVPGPVRAAVAGRYAGNVNKWEAIRNGERKLVEYHAKVTEGMRNYKLSVSPEGEVKSVVRELPAEIEVPVE